MSSPAARPEYVREQVDEHDFGVINKPLTAWERVYGNALVRKALILVILAAAWQAYAMHLENALLFPTFTDTMHSFLARVASGELPRKSWVSIKVLLQGYAIGLVLALVVTMLAMATRIGNDLLETLTAMFNPLPAIALLPLALLWFGLGIPSLVFVIVHSVLWAVALNTHTGFLAVSETLRMVGQNCGLRGVPYVARILIPAAFPSILSGLKIGWAFSWRTLIAAELVFGVSSRSGGLGWFIFEKRNQLETASVFAGLTTVIIIGLVIESVVFRTIEIHTVRKWGMQR